MSININNLPIPATLLAAIDNGRWLTPKDSTNWLSLLPQETAHHALLYSLRMIETENAPWPNESRAFYLGRADEHRAPGDIDPRKSLLIADLGPDKMVALDYRESLDHPCVLYIKDYPDGSTRWIKIAQDIEVFIRALGLEAVERKSAD